VVSDTTMDGFPQPGGAGRQAANDGAPEEKAAGGHERPMIQPSHHVSSRDEHGDGA